MLKICRIGGIANRQLLTDLGVTQATQGPGLSRAALRSGTDEGSVLNPYNP